LTNLIACSEIHPDSPAADCGLLYVGDAILFVNGVDLREVAHVEAVRILSEAAAQPDAIALEVTTAKCKVGPNV
jgi:C-terminal processing protease CtpA/Prc